MFRVRLLGVPVADHSQKMPAAFFALEFAGLGYNRQNVCSSNVVYNASSGLSRGKINQIPF
jgi:hypothetical protein